MKTRVLALLMTITCVAVWTLTSVPLRSQVSSGTLVGTVFDPSRAGVPNAKVDAKNVETNVVTSTIADNNGGYRIGNLIAGTYSISASASGFSTSTMQNVTVDANKTATANLSIEVGTIATTIDVTT